MAKRRTSFEMEIDVNFLNQERSFKHFIEGDWKESFFTFDDLDEVAKHLAYCFHIESSKMKKMKIKKTHRENYSHGWI